MQEQPSLEYVIQGDLKKEPRREHQKEDTFEVIMNNHQGVQAPFHGRTADIMWQDNEEGLPLLKSCGRVKLGIKVTKVNETVKDIHTNKIIQLNSVLYAAEYVVTKRIVMMQGKKTLKNKEPF